MFKQQPKLTNRQAEEKLKGTVSSEKIELLWEDYGISYGKDILAIERKGSVVFRKWVADPAKLKIFQDMTKQRELERKTAKQAGLEEPTYPYKLREPRKKQQVVIEHVDIIRADFWIRELGFDVTD